MNAEYYHEFTGSGFCIKCGMKSDITDLRPQKALCPGNRKTTVSQTTTPKSDIEILLERSRELEAKATKAPWTAYDNFIQAEIDGERGNIIAELFAGNPIPGDNCNDTEFIAHTRNTSALKDQMIRTLSAELECIRKQSQHWDLGTTREKLRLQLELCQVSASGALIEASRLARTAMEKSE